MANRRMFSKLITNSSKFLMMPLSAQALYFQLGMNADDDGYVEHFTIMRMVGGNPDDLKLLVVKNLVEVFDDHVLIILDWERHNKIQPSRKIDSEYTNIYIPSTKCQQITDKPPTQVRLGKVSIGKDNNGVSSADNIPYKEIIDYLNLAAGKDFKHKTKLTLKLIRTRWNEGLRLEDFKKAIDNHQKFKGTEYYMNSQPKTVFNEKMESRAQDGYGDHVKKREPTQEEIEEFQATRKLPKCAPPLAQQ